MNSYQWHSSIAKPSKPTHVSNVDVLTALVVQVETLSKKIDELLVTKQQALIMQRDLCGGHGNQECQALKSLIMPSKHVDYIRNAPRP